MCLLMMSGAMLGVFGLGIAREPGSPRPTSMPSTRPVSAISLSLKHPRVTTQPSAGVLAGYTVPVNLNGPIGSDCMWQLTYDD